VIRTITLGFLILFLMILLAAEAGAHAFLGSAVPAVGSTVASAPKELRLRFTEAVEVRFSHVTVTREGGKEIRPLTIAAVPSDPQMIVVTLPAPLVPGVYVVRWRVVSGDTHKTQGDYRFTVKP